MNTLIEGTSTQDHSRRKMMSTLIIEVKKMFTWTLNVMRELWLRFIW